MRLQKIYIRNFRSFQEETITVDDYTCLVGPNGSGKSAVLTALNVFFRDQKEAATDVCNLSDEDFHHKNTREPAIITLTFVDLTRAAQKDLRAYYRQGQLVISAKATWDAGRELAEVKQYGSRYVMEEFAPWFAADTEGKLVPELRKIYNSLQTGFSDLPKVSTKPKMKQALQDFEEEHRELCRWVEAEEQFYGWSRGVSRMGPHIQWVYLPAVKDPSSEQEEGSATALGQLLKRAIRSKVDFTGPLAELRDELAGKYRKVVENEKDALDDLRRSLETRLREWTHSGTRVDLNWHYDRERIVKAIGEPIARASIGEHKFIGEIARLGHGVQRAFLLTLLQELATSDTPEGPTLLLGFEEPELYQHPPQARHMASVLEELPEKNAQILISTHSPYFVPSKGFECVRMIRKCSLQYCSKVGSTDYAQVREDLKCALGEEPGTATSIMARVEQIMQPAQKELFFTSVAVLVEGPEDIAFVSTHLHLTNQWGWFREQGCHFIPARGKCNISRLLAIAKRLGIPCFVILDADGDKTDPGTRRQHERDNSCLLRMCGIVDPDPFPEKTYWGRHVVVWASNISDAVHADFGKAVYEEAESTARRKHGFVDGVRRKNPLLIAATLEELRDRSKTSTVLEKLCKAILSFAHEDAGASKPTGGRGRSSERPLAASRSKRRRPRRKRGPGR